MAIAACTLLHQAETELTPDTEPNELSASYYLFRNRMAHERLHWPHHCSASSFTTILALQVQLVPVYLFLQQPLLLVRSLSTRNSQMEGLTRRQRAKKLVENVENNPRLFSAKELKRRRWPVIIQEHARFPGDTGSPEVLALLTERITYLTEHFKFHKKDKHSRRGLHHILNQRHKLLLYLRRKDKGRYEALITKLNLKDRLAGKLF